jgi:hypothetical protein
LAWGNADPGARDVVAGRDRRVALNTSARSDRLFQKGQGSALAFQGNPIWNFLGMTMEEDASPGSEGQKNKSFLVLFFKKEQEKALLFEKRSKNFC